MLHSLGKPIVAARQLGIQIPSQLSVIGIDGHDLAEMFTLTTLEQFPSRQGARAVELVMERMADDADSPAQAITMPVHLTVRRSTTAPPPEAPAH